MLFSSWSPCPSNFQYFSLFLDSSKDLEHDGSICIFSCCFVLVFVTHSFTTFLSLVAPRSLSGVLFFLPNEHSSEFLLVRSAGKCFLVFICSVFHRTLGSCFISGLKKCLLAWLVWLSGWSVSLHIKGSQVHFLVQGTYLGCSSSPGPGRGGQGVCRRQPTNWSPPRRPFLPPTLSLKKKSVGNNTLRWGFACTHTHTRLFRRRL